MPVEERENILHKSRKAGLPNHNQGCGWEHSKEITVTYPYIHRVHFCLQRSLP